MNIVYLDTNIFVYASNSASPFYSVCNKFIDYCLNNEINLATSTESLQEIIHIAKRDKKIEIGLKTVNFILAIVHLLIEINKETIILYLDLVKKYKSFKHIESRDFIHIAASFYNKITTVITFDKEFKNFREIKTLTPQEYLNNLLK